MKYEFYEFRKEEYQNRLTDLKRKMKEEKVDAIVLTEEENIRWLSGYWVFTMEDSNMPTALVIPYQDNIGPILILPREGTGEKLSWIENIRYWEEDYRNAIEADRGEVLVNVLNGLPPGQDRIGLELGNGMNIKMEQKDIDFLKENLAGSEIIDISNVLLDLRSIKSDTEIEKLRIASDITTRSLISGFQDIKEGITERKLGQNFARYFFEYGATGLSHIGVGFGSIALEYAHADPKEYPLKPGEIVKVDIGCTFEGYRCDMYRMAVIGDPDPQQEKVANTISEANKAIIKNLRDGIKCSTIYGIALKVFQDAGLDGLPDPSNYFGHGIGLGIHEPPYIFINSDSVLKSGMVLSIEPWTRSKEDPSFAMNVEDVAVVTEDGGELLTKMERGLMKIGKVS